jgi:hypothetical protein
VTRHEMIESGLLQGAIMDILNKTNLMNVAIKHPNLQCATVIPAKSGIQEIRRFMDSGSPLHCGRNDILNCRINN